MKICVGKQNDKDINDGLVKSSFCPLLSFPRRRESSNFDRFWIPAFAGMTGFRLFMTSTFIEGNYKNDNSGFSSKRNF